MRLKSLVLAVICIVFVSTPAFAKIIHVPADSSTIQGGINGAVNGDTVLVAPGTYYEHISFTGKGILVKSEQGPEVTVIDKVDDGTPIVLFVSGETRDAILDGFWIRNAQLGANNKGAIFCQGSSPTILNNIVSDNAGSEDGAGIYLDHSSAFIQGNTISNNTAKYGSAIHIADSQDDSVINNFIHNNSAVVCPGIRVLRSSHATLAYNVIANNIATYSIPGILIQFSSYVQILNNTLASNSGDRGSIDLVDTDSVYIINNIVVGNSQGWGIYLRYGSAPVIEFNDVWDNLKGNYYDLMPGQGCFSVDPLFCDPLNNNYFIFDMSPCVGAGQKGEDIGALGIGCNLGYGVSVIASGDIIGFINTQVQVSFNIANRGEVTDTYDLVVSDSLNWQIDPTSSSMTLDPGQQDSIIVTVSIPATSHDTKNKLILTATSQNEPRAKDSDWLTIITVIYFCGDVNVDSLVDITDAVYLINYLFKSGPPPCEPEM